MTCEARTEDARYKNGECPPHHKNLLGNFILLNLHDFVIGFRSGRVKPKYLMHSRIENVLPEVEANNRAGVGGEGTALR